MTNANPALQGLQPTPEDPRAARLRAIHAQWQQYPGRAPNGTGETGLLPNDAQGYSDMLNQQTEALTLEDQLQGKPAPTIRTGSLGGLQQFAHPNKGAWGLS